MLLVVSVAQEHVILYFPRRMKKNCYGLIISSIIVSIVKFHKKKDWWSLGFDIQYNPLYIYGYVAFWCSEGWLFLSVQEKIVMA